MSFRYKSHRRTVSTSDASSSTDGKNENHCVNNDDALHDQIIGHLYSHKARHFIQGLSSTWNGKPPKLPQPDQTVQTFRIIMSALREIIELLKNDYSNLKLTADNSSVSSHQMKAAERYRKELEFHLFKLEELQEKYEVQQKMREGIRSMAYAYILSHGKERESALHNVHSGYKECNNLLCTYESKLQLMMGSFLFEMIGIQGFARMCIGDVFEIIMKHGDQKWKSRGHVLKNDKQSWESKSVLFKAFFNEPLYIKAVEVRGLGKNIMLGNKYCETKGLFSAHPQQMTINLNPSGSLKLKLIIIWNPFSAISGEINSPHTKSSSFGSQSLHHYNSETSVQSTTFSNTESQLSESKVLSSHSNVCDKLSSVSPNVLELSNDSTSFHSSIASSLRIDNTSVIHKNISPVFNHIEDCTNIPESLLAQMPTYIHSSLLQNKNFQISQLWISRKSANSSECDSIEMASSTELSCSNSNKLQEVLRGLMTSLKNVQEQYPELATLYDTVLDIEEILKFQRQSVLGSDVSISIKNALGCFDFLNTAVDEDDDSTNHKIMEEEVKISSSEKVFSIEVENDENLSRSVISSPSPLTTGIEQLDVAIVIHSEYSLKLIEKLCSKTPLKFFELLSLEKLKKQIYCFSTFLKILRGMSKKAKNVSCDNFFMEEEHHLKHVWLQLIEADIITSTVEKVLPILENFVFVLSNGNSSIQSKVATRIVSKMLDRICFTSETIITVANFRLLFIEYESVESAVKKILTEVTLLEEIKSRNLSSVKAALNFLKSNVLFNDALFEICYFLLDEDSHTRNLGEKFLTDVAKKSSLKKQVITAYLEGLESENNRQRQGSCAALHLLEAFECSEQLIHLSHTDESPEVRSQAESAVLNLAVKEMKL